MNRLLVARRALGHSRRGVRQAFHPPLRTFRSAPRLQQSRPTDDAQEPHQIKNESATSQVSRALKEASVGGNNLLAPVHIPEDPHAILNERHPATAILSNSALVVTREMQMMNVMMGYEEANKYVIMDAQGNHVGFMAEQERGMGRMMARQLLRTHRSFTTHIFDREMREILRFHRPFSYINSAIGVYDPLSPSSHATAPTGSVQLSPSSVTPDGQIALQTSDLPVSEMRLIGETKQIWAPLRRKYDLYLTRPSEPDDPALVFEQFARVDEPFLSWDFSLRGADGTPLGSVSRNFTNLGRELFTDAGVYALRMGAAAEPADTPDPGPGASSVLGSAPGMTLDQRAVMLATAVTIDYDYFSRERGGFFGGMPFFMPMGGAGGEAGAAGAGAAGAAGAAGEAGAAGAAGAEVAGTAAGGVARGAAGGVAGYGEGAVTGAGTMAAYEAMQRARGGQEGQQDGASPTAQDYPVDENNPGGNQQEEMSWWEQDQAQQREQDPTGWGNGDQGGDGGGGDGGGDWGDWF